jgi:hypothetical protein
MGWRKIFNIDISETHLAVLSILKNLKKLTPLHILKFGWLDRNRVESCLSLVAL